MDGTPDPYDVVEDSSGEPLGVIYGNVGSVDFNFAVTGPARKLDYVQCRHAEHGLLLGQIVDIFRETRLSYDGASLLGAEDSGKEVRGRLSARVSIFGYADGGGHLEAPLTPLNAGQKVFRAEDSFVEGVLGLKGGEGGPGVYIGKLKGHDIEVALDPNVLIQRHASVIAKTGGGKSYMAGILVEGLAKLGAPVVVVDPHGEYGSLTHPNTDPGDLSRMLEFGVRPGGLPGAVVEYAVDQELNVGALPLRFTESGLDAPTLLELAGLKSTGPHLALLAGEVDALRRQGARYTFETIIDLLEMDRTGARWNVINALIRLQNSGLFSDAPTPAGEIVRPGQCAIVNLRGLGPDLSNITVALLMKLLFQCRKRGTVRPHMVVLEEAHMFCPQGGQTQARDIVRTVAAEGRKFGMGLGVITQRPAKVDKNVLSQCHTQVILKVTNPNDVKSVTAAAEGLSTRMGAEIQRLPVGVALVVGGSLTAPVLVEVRPRMTKHGGREIDVVGEIFSADGTVDGGGELPPSPPPPPTTPEEITEGPGSSLVGAPVLGAKDRDPRPEKAMAAPGESHSRPENAMAAAGEPHSRPENAMAAAGEPHSRPENAMAAPEEPGHRMPAETAEPSDPAGSEEARDDVADRIGKELWDAIKGALSNSRDGRRSEQYRGGGGTIPKEK